MRIVSRLYFKWTKLNISINDAWPEDQALEASLRSFSNIADKIENVSSLMYRSGIQDFLASQSELSEMIATRFDKIDLNNQKQPVFRRLFLAS